MDSHPARARKNWAKNPENPPKSAEFGGFPDFDPKMTNSLLILDYLGPFWPEFFQNRQNFSKIFQNSGPKISRKCTEFSEFSRIFPNQFSIIFKQ